MFLFFKSFIFFTNIYIKKIVKTKQINREREKERQSCVLNVKKMLVSNKLQRRRRRKGTRSKLFTHRKKIVYKERKKNNIQACVARRKK